jgi:hypothetical protein
LVSSGSLRADDWSPDRTVRPSGLPAGRRPLPGRDTQPSPNPHPKLEAEEKKQRTPPVWRRAVRTHTGGSGNVSWRSPKVKPAAEQTPARAVHRLPHARIKQTRTESHPTDQTDSTVSESSLVEPVPRPRLADVHVCITVRMHVGMYVHAYSSAEYCMFRRAFVEWRPPKMRLKEGREVSSSVNTIKINNPPPPSSLRNSHALSPVSNRQLKRPLIKKRTPGNKNKRKKNQGSQNLISSHLKIPSAWIDQICNLVKGGWMDPSLFFSLAVHNHITSSPLRCVAARTRPPTQGTALPAGRPDTRTAFLGGGPRSPGRGLVGRLVCGCVGWDGDDWLKWEGCPICFPRSRSCQTSVVFAPFLS